MEGSRTRTLPGVVDSRKPLGRGLGSRVEQLSTGLEEWMWMRATAEPDWAGPCPSCKTELADAKARLAAEPSAPTAEKRSGPTALRCQRRAARQSIGPLHRDASSILDLIELERRMTAGAGSTSAGILRGATAPD